MRENKAELTDDYLQLSGKQHFEFYQVEDSREQYSLVDADDLEIIGVFLRVDKQFNIYERR